MRSDPVLFLNQEIILIVNITELASYVQLII